MKLLILVLALLFIGCGPGGGDDTTINIASGDTSNAGDPINENHSSCADSEDQCGQQVEE